VGGGVLGIRSTTMNFPNNTQIEIAQTGFDWNEAEVYFLHQNYIPQVLEIVFPPPPFPNNTNEFGMFRHVHVVKRLINNHFGNLSPLFLSTREHFVIFSP
jgi:hypothetical protein